MASLAIHGGVLLLIPADTDRGVAEFGQGGITISLGPAGREAGGEIAAAQMISDVVEEVMEVEPEAFETSQHAELLEADRVPDTQVPVVRDIEASEIEPVEVEIPDVETAEIAPVELLPVQSDETILTAEVATPPVPVRRPQLPNKHVVQELQQAQAAAKPVDVVQPKQATPLEESRQARPDVAEGDSETQTSNQVAGEGGRSGQSGLSEAGQGDNTAGGGAPGVKSDYYREVLAWLEKHKRYPRRSKLRNEQGVVLLRFVVTRDGTVTLSRIKESSGHKRLDKEAIGMIERAQPLPAMPDDMRQAQLNFVVPVKFHLQ